MKPFPHQTGLPQFDQTSFDKGLSDGFRGHVWWPGPGIEPLSYAVGYQESGTCNPRTEQVAGDKGSAVSARADGTWAPGAVADAAMRRGTAIHEGGHAIVMWALGLTVGTIEIGINGDDSIGRANLLTSDEHLPLIDRIALCVAGIEAQHIFDCATHELAGHGDLGKVVELLDGIPEPRAYQMRGAGYERAFALILMHRTKLLNVAERLVESGKVSPDEFAMIVID